tara:strand:- start:446 stop:886 length:441 start_codon:yes stop_codon:yes gene_type:complete
MSEFLGTKLEFIEPGESAWRHKLNMNFATLRAFKKVISNYIIDASPPTNATYDYIIGVDANANDVDITLPTLATGDLGGRKIEVFRMDNNDTYSVKVKTDGVDELNGGAGTELDLLAGSAGGEVGSNLTVWSAGKTDGWFGKTFDN